MKETAMWRKTVAPSESEVQTTESTRSQDFIRNQDATIHSIEE